MTEDVLLPRKMAGTFERCDFLTGFAHIERDRALDAVANSRNLQDALALIGV